MKEQPVIINPLLASTQENLLNNSELVGKKAVGLNIIPANWTPPFFVITTNAHRIWKESTFDEDDCVSWLLKEQGLEENIMFLLTGEERKLIVRSSAPWESLGDRGRLISQQCEGRPETVASQVHNIWSQIGDIKFDEQSLEYNEVALIVQVCIPSYASGHLSNERRVSKRIIDWMCEFDKFPKGKRLIDFSVKTDSQSLIQTDLSCNKFSTLNEKLKELAIFTSSHSKERCHYEWVWDNERLWVVQLDIEEEYVSPEPLKIQLKNSAQLVNTCLKVLVEASNVSGQWGKIESLHIFRECGLPSAKVFVLEDPKIICQLSIGELRSDLSDDLLTLLKTPIVIRTDVNKGSSKTNLLLPRTDSIKDIKEVKDFLVCNSQQFCKQGLNSSEFCFIFHRYIHAQKSAFSYSSPKVPRVAIDSIWGLPDGLLFYPHDSFEVDTKTDEIKKLIRCKPKYIEMDKDDKWSSKRCGRPWDWKPSVSGGELKEIAQMSYSVAQRLGHPVHIMYFVNVDPGSGHPSILPWVCIDDIPSEISVDADVSRFGVKLYQVSNKEDLDTLIDKIEVYKVKGTKGIMLKPELELLLRSREFIMGVSQVALKNDLSVVIEGSVLSHIYYMLAREGVKVKCINPFKPKNKRQRFGKLVRDLIPVHIKSHGEEVRTYRLTDKELLPLLKSKAVEEAFELFWESDLDKIFEEAADLLEVITSISRVIGRSFNKLKSRANVKKSKRGGFEDGIFLVETREVPLIRNEPVQSSFAQDTNSEHSENKNYTPIVKTGKRPRVRGKHILIPLIPPAMAYNHRPTTIQLPEGVTEVLIRYSDKDIIIEPVTSERAHDDRQLTFDF